MLKLKDKNSGYEECFLYSKFIPRLGDIILKGGKYYIVSNVIFDDDEGNIIVEVFVDTSRTDISELFKQVPQEVIDTVTRLMQEGSKLAAVKLLKEKAGVGLREAKEYCESL